MDIFDLLSEEDKVAICDYINYYAGDKRDGSEIAPLAHILRHWNNAKSQYLQSLFKNQLIIRKEIKYIQSINELENKIKEDLFSFSKYADFKTKILNLFSDVGYEVHNVVAKLFHPRCLARNEFITEWAEGDIPLPEGKILKVRVGMKPMKAIGKIAKAFELEKEFEEFRNAHSLILNQKKLKGELCLSIHPLDYMTMSDNNSWSTCMSWRHKGEYRQGTVEMMNSPCVVVAYLNSSTPFAFGKHLWNNKKWRCLFIVDKDFIVSVKNYPYYNETLTAAAANELARLAKWENTEIFKTDNDYFNVMVNEHNVELSFDTNNMYCDFGSDTHSLIVNPNLNYDLDRQWYNYSGKSQCMCCGDHIELCTDNGEEWLLLCQNCGDYLVCSLCGAVIGSDAGTWIGDEVICEDCADEHTGVCAVTEELCWNEDLMAIHLSRSREDWDDKNYWTDSIWISEDAHYLTETWEQYFKIAVPRMKMIEKTSYWSPSYLEPIYYVCVDDLTERGLDLFGHSLNEIEEYLNPQAHN